VKRLGLLRHAKSDWDDRTLRDFDRGLNNRGRAGAALMGAHIRKYGVEWDKIVASPAERVRKTLDASGLDYPIDWDMRAYLADYPTLEELLRERGKTADSVLLVGHNPGLEETIFALVPPQHENDLFAIVAEKYPTATFAVLELDIDDWRDCTRGCGRLIHLARPRDLDPNLGPEKFR